MKLRVRILGQTNKVELQGDEPSLTELKNHIKETLLSSHGLSSDTEFSLSLNGSEPLSDTEESLSSCGIVSGDLICIVLPESAAANTNSTSTSSSKSTSATSSSAKPAETSNKAISNEEKQRNDQQTTATMTGQPSSSSSSSSVPPATPSHSEDVVDVSPQDLSPSRWEPMLCSEAEEGQAPLSLELLYHSAQAKIPSEAIAVAVHQLMIETGFIPQGSNVQPGEMPAEWRSGGGVYRLHYSHPLCENSLVMVVLVSMGPVLVINATPKVNESVDTIPKLTLNPSRYVSTPCPGESAAAAFRDLKKLSRIFKDQVAYPLIAAARDAMSLPEAFGLAVLPPELLLRIFRLLDVSSVLRLSSVCRRFSVATADSTLWKHLFHRDFRDANPNRSRDTDWKMLYKRSYKQCSERRRATHLHSFPPYRWNPPDIFQPVPLPLPHPLPGIIGGDYDQRPNFPHFPQRRFDPIRPLERQPGNNFPRLPPQLGRSANVRRGFI